MKEDYKKNLKLVFDKILIDKSKRFLVDEVWDLKLVSKFAKKKKKLLKKRTLGTTDFIKIIWSEIHLCTCARALCQSQAMLLLPTV